MKENEITIQNIYVAYRKLKNHYYYDNSTLHTRMKIASFEKDFHDLEKNKFKTIFENKCSALLNLLNEDSNSENYFFTLLNEIDFCIMPKSFHENKGEDFIYITNLTEKKNIKLDSYNVMIDAPVEIHLISTLWLMFVGVYFSKLTKPHNYAYNFTLYASKKDKKQHLDSGFQLYSPYYKGYQNWRDNALKKAEEILDSKKNATIVSLDIQRYFYNVKINLPEFIDKLIEDNNIEIPAESKKIITRLTFLLHNVHLKYQEKISLYLQDIIGHKEVDKTNTILPVGLLSSGLLGNLYLYKFDRLVMQNLHPDYYGRYVDDMLFVIGETNAHADVKGIMSTYFSDEKRGLLKKDEIESKSEKNVVYKLLEYDNLFVQEKKLVIQNFAHYESRAAIKKFRNNINKQRSEFRFLPDEDVMERDFEEAAFTMQYSGSINTFHSIKEFKGDKFGASSYLAHCIFLACCGNSKSAKNQTNKKKQILSFFRGKTAIEFYSLWEKVATYFVINEDVQSLNDFQSHILEAINALNYEDNDENVFYEANEKNEIKVLDKIKQSLTNLLQYSLAMPISMHPGFIAPSNDSFEKKCYQYALNIRLSNLFRHPFLGIGGINLTNCLYNKEINLYDTSFPMINFEDLNDSDQYLLPRHVHFEEINHIEFFKKLINA